MEPAQGGGCALEIRGSPHPPSPPGTAGGAGLGE